MPLRPVVSIITPTYDHADFIGRCIESVLGQSYPNWEQVIVDDDSKDATADIVSQYRDPRIRLERQSNQGAFELAKTYNHALSLATGELIAILEGDDFWPPDKLAKLVPAFDDADVVLAYGEAADVDAGGQEQGRKSDTARKIRRLPYSVLYNNPVGSATRYMLLTEGRSLVSPSTVIIRRGALEQIGGFQFVAGLPLTDYPTFLELSLKGKFHFSRRILGYRRRHETSVSVRYAQTIHDTVSDFTLAFLDRHHNRIDLSSSERQRIQQDWRATEDRLHFSEGRLLLLQRRWPEARAKFHDALKSKDLKVRLAAAAGSFFSWLHADIELLMKLAGRAAFRGARLNATDQKS